MFEWEESHWLWLGKHSWWRHSAFFSLLTQQMHLIILGQMEPRSPQSKRFLCLAVSYVLRHDALNPGYLIGVNFSSFHKILGFGTAILSHDLFWVGHFTLDTYKNPSLLWFCECKTSSGKILLQEGHSYPGVHCIWSQTKGNGLSIVFYGFQCKVLCVLTSTTQSNSSCQEKASKGSTLTRMPLLPSGLWAHPMPLLPDGI